MKSLSVAAPLAATLALGLPAVTSAAVRGSAAADVTHLQTIQPYGGPTRIAMPIGADRLRPVAAEQRKGSVRRPSGGSRGTAGGGGGSRSGTVRGTASGRSGGGGGTSDGSSSGAVSRGGVRRPSGDGGQAWSRDRAVARSSVRRARPYQYPYYYYRPNPWFYDRWGYGGFGLGYFYYSPWSWYGPSYYPYGGWGRDDGGVRLKVKPKDAEVLVDGYYAGIVDDFDGTFQSLKLDAGSYRIEVRKPGYESLTFDVRVQRDRTITFRGEMQDVP